MNKLLTNVKDLKLEKHLLVVVLFTIFSLIYFYPLLQGKALFQSDIVQFSGMAKQIVEHREEFNEDPFWIDNAFVGMPSYQVAADYPFDMIDNLDKLVRFLPRPADYLFVYLFSFYILLISLGIRMKYAVFGALTFALSTYLIIILGVGHNTKALAIGYTPIIIAGVYKLLDKKYLPGFILASIGLGLQIGANHYQMTYYFMMMIGLLFLIDLIFEIKNKSFNFKKIGVFVGAFFLAISLNSTSILATKEYTDFSTRGKSEITINPDGSDKKNTNGLSKEYITEYSYGITESLNLLIPRFTGGGSGDMIDKEGDFFKSLQNYDSDTARIIYQNSRLYWGNQPIVEAPAYIGISVFFLFIIGFTFLSKVQKIWIISSIAFALTLSWGKNFPYLTDLFIDYFPFYDKFRAVSSIQVIIEFLIPLVAAIGVYNFFEGDSKKINEKKLLTTTAAFIIPLLILYFVGDSVFSFKSNFEVFTEYPEILNDLVKERITVFKKDIVRSALIIIGLFLILILYVKRRLKLNISLIALTLVVISDLWSFNSNYVNSDDFVNKSTINKPFEANQIDELILSDSSDFRVYEPYRGLSNGKTSYFHKSISGYNAARPQRMQDLFDFYLFRNNMKVLDMLNVKYIVELDNNNSLSLKVNENAKGNAWFVEKIQKTQSANEELLSLDKINLSNIALSKDLDNKTYVLNDTNSIKLNSRKANELIYEVKSDSDQFVVFSEAFYKKGWKATIEGKEHPHFKVNYLLRGMEVPEGEYSLKFSFDPPVIKTGSMISIFSFVILLLSVLVYFKKSFKNV